MAIDVEEIRHILHSALYKNTIYFVLLGLPVMLNRLEWSA